MLFDLVLLALLALLLFVCSMLLVGFLRVESLLRTISEDLKILSMLKK